MKKLLAILALLCPLFAHATIYYVSNCGTGSIAACVNGATGNAGTVSTSPKQTVSDITGLFNSTAACGDSILLARGGAWTSVQMTLRKTGCSASTPMTIGSYTPTWATATDSGTTSASFGANTATDPTKSWTTNQWAGYGFSVQDQGGAWIHLVVASNTATVLTFTTNWPGGSGYWTPIAATPYTLYAPMPLLANTALASTADGIFQFTGGSNVSNGYYKIDGVDLRGGGTETTSGTGAGVFVRNAAHHITVQNSRISGLMVGFNDQPVTGTQTDGNQFRGNYVFNNGNQGLITGGENTLTEYNLFDNNGFNGGVGEHNIYYSLNYDDTGIGRGGVIRGNTLLRNQENTGTGLCGSVSLVAHGRFDSLTIERNLVRQSQSSMATGCYGIVVNTGGYGSREGFTGVVFRGNRVINLGGVGIGCANCVSPLIEDNVIIYEFSPTTGAGGWGAYPIAVPASADAAIAGSLTTTGPIIRNNSIYTALTTAGEFCVFCFNNGGSTTAGSSIVLANNLAFISSGASNHYCYDLGTRVLANFTAFVNNLCYDAGSGGRWSNAANTASFATLALAQASGYDTGGLNTNPSLCATPTKTNHWSMKVCGGPAISAGNSTYKAPLAIDGYKRGATPYIGAFDANNP